MLFYVILQFCPIAKYEDVELFEKTPKIFCSTKLLRYLCGMNKQRTVITYKNYFEDFFAQQTEKVQNKIAKTIEILETINRVPARYLTHLQDGLYEMRVKLGSNIFRVFCFFDGGKFVILLSAFQKKTQKTPKEELERAHRLMKEYFNEKEKKKWT